MIRFLQRLRYNLPRKMTGIWWHKAVWTDARFPIVRWENIGYLDCSVGLIVPMVDLGNNKFAYYKITKVYSSGGSDFVYDGDKWNCNMKFYEVRKGLGIGNYKSDDKPKFLTYNP